MPPLAPVSMILYANPPRKFLIGFRSHVPFALDDYEALVSQFDPSCFDLPFGAGTVSAHVLLAFDTLQAEPPGVAVEELGCDLFVGFPSLLTHELPLFMVAALH